VEDGIFNLTSKSTTALALCAQLVSPQELTFMTAAHPTVRSLPISVFNFEFSMNTAKARYRVSEREAGPLLSYVREDDTREDLMARLEALVGPDTDTDWGTLRLAVVGSRDNIPHFIPRTAAAVSSSPRSSEVGGGGTEALPSVGAATCLSPQEEGERGDQVV
jgi:hypothetical protein